MKRTKLTSALLVVASNFFVSNLFADPFQFQVAAGFNKSETDINFFGFSDTSKSDGVIGSFIYYLAPVDSARGPLVQKPFLTKSSSLQGSFSKESVKSSTQDFDGTGKAFKARYVAASDYIFEVDYLRTELDLSTAEDDPTYGIGVGKYLSADSAAIFRILRLNSDSTLITGSKKTYVAGNGGTSTVFESGLGILSIDSTTGFQFAINGQYYFSDALSIGAGLVYQNIDGGDTQAFTLNADYFVNEKVFVAANFLKNSIGSAIDTDGYTVTVGARF